MVGDKGWLVPYLKFGLLWAHERPDVWALGRRIADGRQLCEVVERLWSTAAVKKLRARDQQRLIDSEGSHDQAGILARHLPDAEREVEIVRDGHLSVGRLNSDAHAWIIFHEER